MLNFVTALPRYKFEIPLIFLISIGLALLVASSPILAAPGDENWDDGFFLPGTNDIVYAMVVDSSGNVYIGGNFSVAGQSNVNGIAKWDGYHWSDVGDTPQSYINSASAMAVDGQDNIYIAGGGKIIVWDDNTWSVLSEDISNSVDALAVDSQDNLYVAGEFVTVDGIQVNYIAKWDGNSWSDLNGGTDWPVEALFVDDDDNLYAGGGFTYAGGVEVNHIAKWDGNTWSALGTGLQEEELWGVLLIHSIGMDSNNNLYVSGSFTNAGGTNAKDIAKWDGNTWSALDDGMQNGVWWEWQGRTGAFAIDTNDNLYTTGVFTYNGNDVSYVIRWDGTQWHPLGTIDFWDYNKVMELDNAGNLYMGGDFILVDDIEVNNITKWNGNQWHALEIGNGIDNGPSYKVVEALTVDGENNIYAGGYFSYAGGVRVNNVAMWNDNRWSGMGGGLDDTILALVADSQGNLYAGGHFQTDCTSGEEFNYIAKWDGHGWRSLDEGMNSSVYALIVDEQDNVYVGGYFIEAGGVEAHRVAMWDGSRWHPLGSGMSGSVNGGAINDFVFDSQGNLYAGGYFTEAGGAQVNYVAKWDGNQWQPLGNGLDDNVLALAIDSQDNIYATGDLSAVYRWDGDSWSIIGTFQYTNLGRALTVDTQDNLYVGASIRRIDDVDADGIAKWDGNTWSALGSGIGGGINSLTVDNYDNIYVGGQFSRAGDKPSANIARWLSGSQPIDPDPDMNYVIYLPLVAGFSGTQPGYCD